MPVHYMNSSIVLTLTSLGKMEFICEFIAGIVILLGQLNTNVGTSKT